MTEYEYMPVSRRRDHSPFVSGSNIAFVAEGEWEAIMSSSRSEPVYSNEATARSLLTRRMKRNREALHWARSKGDAKSIAFYDREYGLLRRPIQPWQEYEWERS